MEFNINAHLQGSIVKDEEKFISREAVDDFRSLADFSPAPTILSNDGKIIYANSSAAKLFGYEEPHELPGKDYIILYHPDHRDSISSKISLTNGSLSGIVSEERINRADGKNMTVSVALRNIPFKGKGALLSVFYDISEYKINEKELRSSQEHYRSLISKLPDYVFIQVEGKIVYVNEAMLKAGGYEPEDMLQKPVFNFIDEKYHRFVIEAINRRLSGYDSEPIEIEIILKSGKRRTVLTKGELIRYENKNALLIVSVDITQRRRAEEQLKAYARELRKSKELLEEKAEQLSRSENELKNINASKDKFFSIIAHDLKGPFNGLLGFSNFLANDIDTLEKEEIQQFASDINDSAQSIFNLLNNLLEWARVQTESNYCKPEELTLVFEINHIINILRNNIEQKSISLNVDIDANIRVLADKQMLRSVIQNLAANAVKFTNPGGNITITAQNSEDYVQVSVSDTGIGINEQVLAKLFKIGENISTEGTNREKGTGLGLILSKEFVEKNGGKISAKSREGAGSVFSFTLPAAAASLRS
ncbi:MAG: PAS domain S-box protein [Bacillota bacterium]